MFELKPIGPVRSPLVDRAQAPKQGNEGSPEAWLEFRPEFQEALIDIASKVGEPRPGGYTSKGWRASGLVPNLHGRKNRQGEHKMQMQTYSGLARLTARAALSLPGWDAHAR